jgi:uncharacterized membrane protein HdeD (DUF308 family)
MREAIARNWWALVLRGLLGIGLGVITFVWPGITLASLVILFGIYAFIDGVLAGIAAVRALERHERWGALLIEGIAGILTGIVAFVWPAITTVVLVFIVGAWAIVTGVFEIAAAMKLRKHVSGEWLLAVTGIASVIFGALILFAPLVGALVLAIWIGAYAFVFGGLMIALGFRLRNWRHGRQIGPQVTVPVH